MKITNILLSTLFCSLASAQCVQAQVVEQDRIPISAQQLALEDQATQLAQAAATALHTGNYAEAEEKARQAEAFSPLAGVPQEVLAAALYKQGKDQEALELYRMMATGKQPRNLLPYAQLLLKSGQWRQAATIYNQVLPHLPDVGPHAETPVVHDGDLMTANSHFSPNVPEPAALATALHIARGMIYNATPDWAGEPQNTEAMAEYGKALQLAPNNALGNYFYSVGWQKLKSDGADEVRDVAAGESALAEGGEDGQCFRKGGGTEDAQRARVSGTRQNRPVSIVRPGAFV